MVAALVDYVYPKMSKNIYLVFCMCANTEIGVGGAATYAHNKTRIFRFINYDYFRYGVWHRVAFNVHKMNTEQTATKKKKCL